MVTAAISTLAFTFGTHTAARQTQSLIERARNGDQKAFLNLFQNNSRRIYNISLRLAGSLSEAEDLTRDLFLEAFHNLDAIGDEQEFSTWLYRRAASHAARVLTGK